MWDNIGQRQMSVSWHHPHRSPRQARWWAAKNIFQHAVAWVVLSLFFYVLLLSSCWVCSVCNDCGPYPDIDSCPNLQTTDEGRFQTICLSGGFQQPGDGNFDNQEYYLKEGKYVCACCGNHLFPHFTKYDSGADFPTFWGAMNSSSLDVDSHSPCVHCGTYREVVCQTCGARLGSVTSDGPAPTGHRYTINGICIHHEFTHGGPDAGNVEHSTPSEGEVEEERRQQNRNASAEEVEEGTEALHDDHHSHCHAFDAMDNLWHEGNCDEDREIIQHSTSLPGGWLEVSITSVLGSTLVFLLFLSFTLVKARWRRWRNPTAELPEPQDETELRMWGIEPPLNLLMIGRNFMTQMAHRQDEPLPQLNTIVIKVSQPDGEAAIAIPDSEQIVERLPSTPMFEDDDDDDNDPLPSTLTLDGRSRSAQFSPIDVHGISVERHSL